MTKYFGTDGIRGIVNKDLTHDIAFRCGNALAQSKKNAKILIGGDTRNSRDYIISSFVSGAIIGGAEVTNIGICTTPGISYITAHSDFDYGVVISASHNPPEFNGIKIFDTNGIKLSDIAEEKLESKFNSITYKSNKYIGKYYHNTKIVNKYINYLVSCCSEQLSDICIVIDTSNGASYKIAPKVFRTLGAKVICINNKDDGDKINKMCGATHPQTLSSYIKKHHADIGFAFDGDADRIIACDEMGNIIDGDIILFTLAKYLKSIGKLHGDSVVATVQTNQGLKEQLQNENINLIRTKVGDKYVIEKMNELNINLGGEKSGHIILKDYISTGDGILTALKLCEILIKTGTKFSSLTHVDLYPQFEINYKTINKDIIMANNLLSRKIAEIEKLLNTNGRVIVRKSGTEPKIRIMVESKDKYQCKKFAKEIEKIIKDIDENIKSNGEKKCVE